MLVNSLTEKTFSTAESELKKRIIDRIKVLMYIMLKFDLFTEQEWRFIANYEKYQIVL